MDADRPAELPAKQTMYLDALREVGTRRKAAAAAHVGRSTVDKWLSENVNGFRARFDEALDDFADSMEAKMFELLNDMKVGHNPTLLIFALKALRPAKYRELTHIPNENARELFRKVEALLDQRAVPEKPDTQLTALEQVEKILKAGK